MTYYILKGTDLECQLLHPIDVLINKLVKDPIHRVEAVIDPLAWCLGYGKKKTVSASLFADVIRVATPPNLYFDIPRDHPIVSKAILDQIADEVASHYNFDWNDHLTATVDTITELFHENPIKTIHWFLKLHEAGLLKISNPETFFKAIEKTIQQNPDANLKSLTTLIKKQAQHLALETDKSDDFVYQWMLQKPLDVFVTANNDATIYSKPVVTAGSRKHMSTIIAEHLLSKKGFVFRISPSSVSTQHHLNGLLCEPEIIRVTHEPMSGHTATYINVNLEKHLKEVPDYVKAISCVL